mmetsp:Transcript_34608/g.82665  ORF Transcript_34608/g.82665 Transcript_34608/m.82665 type:complete len:214 (+) Transcript_34608:2543-3184(+)
MGLDLITSPYFSDSSPAATIGSGYVCVPVMLGLAALMKPAAPLDASSSTTGRGGYLPGLSPTSLTSSPAQYRKNLYKKLLASVSRYCGWPPGTSSGMRNSSCNTLRAPSKLASLNSLPVRYAIVSCARIVVGATPPNAREMLSIDHLFPHDTVTERRIPAVTMEMSSSRRLACLNGDTYSNLSRRSGTLTHSIISFVCIATLLYPVKKSDTLI